MQEVNKVKIKKSLKFIDEDLQQIYEIIYNGPRVIDRYRLEKIYAELMIDWNEFYKDLEREINDERKNI